MIKGPSPTFRRSEAALSSHTTIATVVLLALLVAGCGSTGQSLPGLRSTGTLPGSNASQDFRAGDHLATREGRAAAAALSGEFDAMVGPAIASTLSADDRRQAAAAQQNALEFGRSGAPVAWQNPASGRYGEVVPGAPYTANGFNCRSFVHTVYADGTPIVASGSACRRSDGTWHTA